MSEQDELQKKIVQLMDEALTKHDWSTSPYVRMVASKLREYREQLAHYIQSESNAQAEQQVHSAIPEGMKAMYVVLYSQEGENLKSWEPILLNLPEQIFTRPVYEEELSAKQFVNSKINKNNYAYCICYIHLNEIIQEHHEASARDPLGNRLIRLRNPSLKNHHIIRLYHAGHWYVYQDQKLTLEAGASEI